MKPIRSRNALFAVLLLAFAAICALGGCSAAPDPVPSPTISMEVPASSTSEDLLQTLKENVAPGYTLLLTYTHFTLVEAAGPDPVPTPNLSAMTFICAQATTHGTYNTNAKTGTMFMTAADCTAIINEVNADTLTGTEYPQLTIKYDDTTCNATTHICTVSSFGYADGFL